MNRSDNNEFEFLDRVVNINRVAKAKASPAFDHFGHAIDVDNAIEIFKLVVVRPIPVLSTVHNNNPFSRAALATLATRP